MLQLDVTQALDGAVWPRLQAQPSGGVAWWVWLLVILIIIALVAIWLWRRSAGARQPAMHEAAPERDRKSTRLNSSHLA